MDSAFGHNFHLQSDNSTARIIASAKQAVLTPGEMPKLPKKVPILSLKTPSQAESPGLPLLKPSILTLHQPKSGGRQFKM